MSRADYVRRRPLQSYRKMCIRDRLGTGVKVTEIRPGKVETEFSLIRFHGDKEKADKVYEGIRPLRGEDIALSLIHISPPSCG